MCSEAERLAPYINELMAINYAFHCFLRKFETLIAYIPSATTSVKGVETSKFIKSSLKSFSFAAMSFYNHELYGIAGAFDDDPQVQVLEMLEEIGTGRENPYCQYYCGSQAEDVKSILELINPNRVKEESVNAQRINSQKVQDDLGLTYSHIRSLPDLQNQNQTSQEISIESLMSNFEQVLGRDIEEESALKISKLEHLKSCIDGKLKEFESKSIKSNGSKDSEIYNPFASKYAGNGSNPTTGNQLLEIIEEQEKEVLDILKKGLPNIENLPVYILDGKKRQLQYNYPIKDPNPQLMNQILTFELDYELGPDKEIFCKTIL